MAKISVTRLQKELKALVKDPLPNIIAKPLPANILEWHYVIFPPDDSVYAGGVYHGKVKFPPEYPHKPPSIYMLTPSGRFAVGRRLCLSMSDYHPETWNPLWSISSILNGLLSFMLDTAPTLGSVESSDDEKSRLAARSMDYNVKDPVFRELFPRLVSNHKAHVAIRSRVTQRTVVEEDEESIDSSSNTTTTSTTTTTPTTKDKPIHDPSDNNKKNANNHLQIKPWLAVVAAAIIVLVALKISG